MALQLRVVERGELLGGERGVVEPGVGGQGPGQLADEVAQRRAVEPEEAPGPGEEGQRVAELA